MLKYVEAITLSINGQSAMVSKADTRETVLEKFGEPTALGGMTRRQKKPTIFAYGEDQLELHFLPDGRIQTVYQEHEGWPHLIVKLA